MSKNVGQLNVKLTVDSSQLDKQLDSSVKEIQNANTEIQKLNSSSLDNLKNTITSVVNSIKGIGTQIKSQWNEARTPISSVNDDIKDTMSNIQLMRLPLNDFATQIKNISQEQLEGLFDKVMNEINESKLSVIDLKNELSSLDKSRINATKISELKDVIKQTTVDTQTLKARLSLIKSELNGFKSNNIKDISNSLKDISKNSKNLGTNINSSFKKGLNSLKRFALGLLGIRQGLSYLIQSMKTYISSSEDLTAKTNGISQALAQSLAPYAEIAVNALQKLIHWVILGVAYFTTFINIIFGTNIAIAGASKSMKDLTSNTKKAAKATKEALAPFDDFNILQEDTSDSSLSYVAPDFSGLGISSEEFEGLNAFSEWLNENKDIIKWLLITITAIVAAWTAWNVAVGIFNALIAINPIVLAITAAIAVIALIIVYWDEFKEVAINALNKVGEIFTWLFNMIVTLVGQTIVGLVTGVINIIVGLITTFVGVVVGLITSIYNTILSILNLILDIIKVTINLILDIVNLAIYTMVEGWNLLKDNISIACTAMWEIVKTIFTGIKDFITKILSGDIVGAFDSLKNTVINVLNIIWNAVQQIFGNIWGFITNIAGKIGDTFASAIRGTVNAIINFAENTLNGFIKAINTAIGIINAIPGINISKIKELDIPRLKDGTVATGPMVAEIGEYSGAKTNPEIVSPEDRIYANMVKALRETNGYSNGKQEVEMTINVKYEDGKQIIKKINTAQDEAGRTLLEV